MSDQTSCQLPRKAEIVELHPWECLLGIEKCDRTEFLITLYEKETAGLRFESWPDDVRRKIYDHMTEWVDRHPLRTPRAITYGVMKHESYGRCCVAVLHHAAKG